MTADISRVPNKKEITRQNLVDAARTLVDERCDAKIAIQDITNRANVGLGTFYNYFENKQAIYEAVLMDIRSNFEARLESIRAHQTDAASLVANTLKFCFNEALDNEEWQTFIKKSGIEGEHLLLQDPQQCLHDIKTGAQRGRFKIDDPEFVANLVTGITRHVTREIATGKLSRSAINDTTRYVLRMLGLPELVAKAVTQTPLPPVAAEKRRVVKEILPYLSRTTA
ncbi:MAG: TetR/AcrR family transcriptional regulator [Pseudomonadales bacterium]